MGEEISNFVAEYFASVDPVGLPTSRHEGRLEGKGTIGSKLITPSVEKRKQAHLFVLHHVPDVHSPLMERGPRVFEEDDLGRYYGKIRV